MRFLCCTLHAFDLVLNQHTAFSTRVPPTDMQPPCTLWYIMVLRLLNRKEVSTFNIVKIKEPACMRRRRHRSPGTADDFAGAPCDEDTRTAAL